jgi:uncharacterized glyoxalase superfamily protein PhnB
MRAYVVSTILIILALPFSIHENRQPIMKKATAIIVVDAIEPCLLFWTALGFEITAEVPHENTIGFAMLSNGDVEIMYQSRASMVADVEQSGAPAGLADELARSTTALFVEVAEVDAVLENIEDAEVLVPRRETFYGMDEVFVRAPCGTVVGFAARTEGTDES